MKFPCLSMAAGVFIATSAMAQEKWTVHEWGTFTALQNESGQAIGGINTDDEPVPGFVHRLVNFLLLTPTEIPANYFQGAPRCHPDVTMRLETPVIYFHPPSGANKIRKADVRVKFRGGWLTEFYPAATPDAPGLNQNERFNFPALPSSTVSQLAWNNFEVGGGWPMTNTTAHVWTSPRAVKASSVRTANGEAEKFLFYRGVAHINAPLRVSRDAGAGELLFRSQLEELPAGKPLPVRSIWLVDILSDGRIAFRPLPPLSLTRDAKTILARTPAAFDTRDYATGNLGRLKTSLQNALLAEGLFADEASALLNTWELSYFKSAGTRVFFMVPREWTDFYLPLETSLPAEISRVMVGRIELVTTEQRAVLAEMAGYSPERITSDALAMRTNFYASRAIQPKTWAELASGKKHLDSEISVPKSYQAYLELGRFRNALVLDEVKTHPGSVLTNFVSEYALRGYEPAAQ